MSHYIFTLQWSEAKPKAFSQHCIVLLLRGANCKTKSGNSHIWSRSASKKGERGRKRCDPELSEYFNVGNTWDCCRGLSRGRIMGCVWVCSLLLYNISNYVAFFKKWIIKIWIKQNILYRTRLLFLFHPDCFIRGTFAKGWELHLCSLVRNVKGYSSSAVETNML